MRKSVAGAALLSMIFLVPQVWAGERRDEARAQVAFGIAVAQKGLWKEALFRWEKAVEIDPTYAAAYNHLAIAYEHEGQFEKARQAYEKAVELDPKNTFVQQNFEFFKEINDRASSRNPG